MSKIYLDDLFPHGIAQAPYLYPPTFNNQLNEIMAKGERKQDQRGIYYEIKEAERT